MLWGHYFTVKCGGTTLQSSVGALLYSQVFESNFAVKTDAVFSFVNCKEVNPDTFVSPG